MSSMYVVQKVHWIALWRLSARVSELALKVSIAAESARDSSVMTVAMAVRKTRLC